MAIAHPWHFLCKLWITIQGSDFMNMSHAATGITTDISTSLSADKFGWRAGEERLSFRKFVAPEVISVASPAFTAGGAVPDKYGEDGQNISPPIKWWGVPQSAASVVLIVENPDAPTHEPYIHWIVYDIASTIRSLPEGYMGMGSPVQGKNSKSQTGYVGMASHRGNLPHHYHFQVYALARMLKLGGGAGYESVLSAMKAHVIGKGRLVGTFDR
jgi:Raf kinase inhibitor-like YbhB/YbcL family protein